MTDSIFKTPSIIDRQWIYQVKNEEKCAKNWPLKWGIIYLDDQTFQSSFNNEEQIQQKQMEMFALPFSKKDTTSNEYGKRKSIDIFQDFDRAIRNFRKSKSEMQFLQSKQPQKYFP